MKLKNNVLFLSLVFSVGFLCANKFPIIRLENNFSIKNNSKIPLWVVLTDKFKREQGNYKGIYLTADEVQAESISTDEPIQIAVYTKKPSKKISMDYDSQFSLEHPNINPKFTPNPQGYFYLFPRGKKIHLIVGLKKDPAKNTYVPYIRPHDSFIEYLKNENIFYDNISENDIQDLSANLLGG